MKTFANPNILRDNYPKPLRGFLGRLDLASAILDREYPRRYIECDLFKVCTETYRRRVRDGRTGFTINRGKLRVLHLADFTCRLSASDLPRAAKGLSMLSEIIQADGDRDAGVVAFAAHSGITCAAGRLGFRRFEPRPGFVTPLARLIISRETPDINKAGIPTGRLEVAYMPTADLHRVYGSGEPSEDQLANLAAQAKSETRQLAQTYKK